MENYLVINGKRVDLTEEQIEKLGLEIEKKSPFDRGNEYYFINTGGDIIWEVDGDTLGDKTNFLAANYCTDYDIMTSRAKEEVLSRLLWRFSMENGGSKIDWSDNEQLKYRIYKDTDIDVWLITRNTHYNTLGAVHFINPEIAQRAIDEIVKPFYAGELEVCKIWEE